MRIGAPKESFEGEARVAMTPDSALQLQKLGYDCLIQSGAGLKAGFTDAAYTAANVRVVPTEAELFQLSDVVAKVRPPTDAEVDLTHSGQLLISFLYPAQNKDLMERLKDRGTNVIAMDMVPRISRAQKMDALSSMANIAGYRAVIEAANNFGRFFTGQVTAAGKVPPAKVMVIGAGVAGLAAIGAANSLGAIVRAFDTRPEVKEQVQSMGAEFLELDFKEEAGSGDGYAKVVPEARGQAASIRTAAEGYKTAKVARATGDSQRFSLLVDEYKSAPEVTRKRLWLETVQEVLTENRKIVGGDSRQLIYVPMQGKGDAAAQATSAVSTVVPIEAAAQTDDAQPANSGNARPARQPRSATGGTP